MQFYQHLNLCYPIGNDTCADGEYSMQADMLPHSSVHVLRWGKQHLSRRCGIDLPRIV